MITIPTREHALMAALLALAVIAPARTWAVDGARIVFGGVTVDGKSRIYVTTPEGADFEQLTPRDSSGIHPAWSHDGRTIALAYSRFGDQGGIYLMDPGGGNVRALSDQLLGAGWRPTWSPRDDAVAFESSRLGFDRRGIYVVNLDGGPEVRITDPFEHSRAPSWNPVRDRIAYAWRRDDGLADIRVMDPKGRPLGQLIARPWSHAAPSWHPRGNALAFGSRGENDDNPDIYTMDADGTGIRRVTTHPAEDRRPVWSPDGTQILVESFRDGAVHLYIVGLGGRVVQRVTDARPPAFAGIEGSSWFDPAVPRSVSPTDRRATTWGWLRRLGAAGAR